MAAQDPDIQITSLRGGMNDTDPPTSLPEDQCVLAMNVEFFNSPLGERRNGTTTVDITNSGLFTTSNCSICHLSEWYPTNDPAEPEWWAMSSGVGVSYMARRIRPALGGTWTPVTPMDPIDLTAVGLLGLPGQYNIQSQSCTGLIPLNFFAYPSSVDRNHVWDGSQMRRTGLQQPPAAPTVANEGAGSYAGVRYFRIRYITEANNGKILRRSEPSINSVAFTPSGGGAGATITRPALIGEGETHWELEGSIDGFTFYRLSTTGISSTTVNEETVNGLSYPGVGPLSEAIGDYLLQPAFQFLGIDGDRLLGGGHQTDITRMSSIYWSPVFADPGVGNNERLPLGVNNSVNLDNGDGGPVTGITDGIDGIWYAFKWQHIYQMVRTGNVNRAYEVITVSTSRGAIPGSVFPGLDENGLVCYYFLDPLHGPSRVGASGVQALSGLRTTWSTVNTGATLVMARGCYYGVKQQAHFWVPTRGFQSPNLKLVLQVSEVRPDGHGGVGRGWSQANGKIADLCLTVAMLTETVTVGGLVQLSYRPYVGTPTIGIDNRMIHRCDDGGSDMGLTAVVGQILTKPYLAAGLLNRWGVMAGTLLVSANSSQQLNIQVVRDFGLEKSSEVDHALAAVGAETFVIVDIDDFHMTGARAIQVFFADAGVSI